MDMDGPLRRRATLAFRGAALAALACAIVWYVAHELSFGRAADVSILSGFVELHRPGLDRITNWIAHLCDPQPYVELAAIPVVMALLRGRPRVAIAVGIVLLGANETTQLLKPVLAGARDTIPWNPLGNATFPSGHATAAMSLALSMVLAAPARQRPKVAAAMAGFAIAVCYSFLELSWHYPSDVLGGFLVATMWSLLAVGVLSRYEARHPSPGVARPAFSVAQALGPPIAMLCAAAALATLILLARPHAVVDYAQAHRAFIVGAAVIATFGFALASGLNLMLRRG